MTLLFREVFEHRIHFLQQKRREDKRLLAPASGEESKSSYR
jgi:hypothetical protein